MVRACEKCGRDFEALPSGRGRPRRYCTRCVTPDARYGRKHYAKRQRELERIRRGMTADLERRARERGERPSRRPPPPVSRTDLALPGPDERPLGVVLTEFGL